MYLETTPLSLQGKLSTDHSLFGLALEDTLTPVLFSYSPRAATHSFPFQPNIFHLCLWLWSPQIFQNGWDEVTTIYLIYHSFLETILKKWDPFLFYRRVTLGVGKVFWKLTNIWGKKQSKKTPQQNKKKVFPKFIIFYYLLFVFRISLLIPSCLNAASFFAMKSNF